MFFVIIFLALAAFASYLFPNWSWVTTLLVSFGCVAARVKVVVASVMQPMAE